MSKFREGDLVEAVKGESVVRGRARRGTFPGAEKYMYLGDSAAIDEVYVHDGWTVTVIERATVNPLRADLVALFESYADDHDDRYWIPVEVAADLVLDHPELTTRKDS